MGQKENVQKLKQDYLLKNIPINVYRGFAATCKLKGQTVREALIRFMTVYNQAENIND